jgi:hypothetical protein
MVTKDCLDWLVQLELVGMDTHDHSLQKLSPPSWHAGYSVVDQYCREMNENEAFVESY